jgi:hypothetical protein
MASAPAPTVAGAGEAGARPRARQHLGSGRVVSAVNEPAVNSQ